MYMLNFKFLNLGRFDIIEDASLREEMWLWGFVALVRTVHFAWILIIFTLFE